MSLHLTGYLTPTNHAVAIRLLYLVSAAVLPSITQAADFGKTIITSAQNEPLAASMTVADIKVSEFSVDLASSAIYEQLGLVPTASMSARFEPTSATSGNIFIYSSQPIDMPFADIVLTLNNQGQQTVIPKTLLLPLSNRVLVSSLNSVPDSIVDRTDISSNALLDNDAVHITKDTTLPTINTQPLLNTQPLIVRQGMPPPLLTTTDMDKQTRKPLQMSRADAEKNTVATDIRQASKATSLTTDMGNQPDIEQNILAAVPLPATGISSQSFDTFTIQVTRRIRTSNHKDTVDAADQSLILVNDVKQNVRSPATPSFFVNQAVTSYTSQPLVDFNSTSKQGTSTLLTPKPNMLKDTKQRNDSLRLTARYNAESNNIDSRKMMANIEQQSAIVNIKDNSSRLPYALALNFPIYTLKSSQQNQVTDGSYQQQTPYLIVLNQHMADSTKSIKTYDLDLDNWAQKISQPNQKLAEPDAQLKKYAINNDLTAQHQLL